jgi:hypothetical protein
MIETTVNLETLNDDSISLPPGTVVGYRANGKPIYNIAGGAIDIDSSDLVDDDDDADEHDDSDDAGDEWVPPSKEEFEKLLAAKQKADSEAAARKRFLREAGIDPKTGKPLQKPKIVLEDLDDDDDDSDEEDVERTRKAVKGETKARSDKAFQRQLEREIAKTERRIRDEATVLLAAVPTALNEAGWNGRNLERMIKLLDLDEIQVDSDGEIDGLNDQVEELKKDFPEFFKRQRMKEAAKEVADTKTVGGSRKQAPAAKENLSWTDRLKNDLYRS